MRFVAPSTPNAASAKLADARDECPTAAGVAHRRQQGYLLWWGANSALLLMMGWAEDRRWPRGQCVMGVRFAALCDEPGCTETVASGWGDPYRWTCSYHFTPQETT